MRCAYCTAGVLGHPVQAVFWLANMSCGALAVGSDSNYTGTFP